MTGERSKSALARIEAALARIEGAAARVPVANMPHASDDGKLRAELKAALDDLDRLIAQAEAIHG